MLPRPWASASSRGGEAVQIRRDIHAGRDEHSRQGDGFYVDVFFVAVAVHVAQWQHVVASSGLAPGNLYRGYKLGGLGIWV